MHTITRGATTFNYNSDMSGDVRVIKDDGTAIEIPADDLISFIAGFVRGERIAALESMTEREVIGLAPVR